MTDPGEFGGWIGELPHDVGSLARAVRGLLVHGDCLALYGLDAASAPFVRSTLPVRERLGRLAARGTLDLVAGRPPAEREVGTCRDFALLLTSFLRAHGVEARCRCGFASYLGEGWEDHWLCEYRHPGDDPAWRLADAQLGEIQRGAWSIAFDPLDVPRGAFLTAGEAWIDCRKGRFSHDLFGNGATRGVWFMGVDVVRDHLSLSGRETSEWDRWREATAEQRRLTDGELSKLDALARHSHGFEGPPVVPPWLDAPPARNA